jgi:hypothetical protein
MARAKCRLDRLTSRTPSPLSASPTLSTQKLTRSTTLPTGRPSLPTPNRVLEVETLDRAVPVEEGETPTECPPRPLLETLSVTFMTRTKSRSRSSIRVGPALGPLGDVEAVSSRTGVEEGVLLEGLLGSEVDEVDSRRVVPGVTVDPRGVDGVLTVDEAGAVTAVGTR